MPKAREDQDEKDMLHIRLEKNVAAQIRRCAVLRGASINAWVAEALAEKAAAEYKEHGIDQLEKKFAEVAKGYKPGRVATLDGMLAMAKVFAESDTRDGLNTKHIPKPKGAKTRSRKA